MSIINNEQFLIINEAYPHIGKKIAFLWGQSEFNQMLCNLINDTRDGNRQGFPKPVASALLRLSMLHDAEFPQLVSKTSDVWTLNFRPF